jgi:hypothetical protein
MSVELSVLVAAMETVVVQGGTGLAVVLHIVS